MQQTLKHTITFTGIGLHSGQNVNMKIIPAKENHGIVFHRTDVEPSTNGYIEADFRNVQDTKLCTVLVNEYGYKISTVEHIMSALYATGIDNALIEIDSEEVPIMDGSAISFLQAINQNGIVKQNAERKVLTVTKPIKLTVDDKSVELHPAEEFIIDFTLDYNGMHLGEHIGKQRKIFVCNDDNTPYQEEIASARTFGFAHEISYLQQNGLAKGASLNNAIGINTEGVMNQEGLRHEDEFVRHKILDCIGDLALCGYRIKAKVIANKAGHCLNNKILHLLWNTSDAFICS